MEDPKNPPSDDADYGPLSDEALVEMAEELFLELDARELEDGAE